MKMVPTTGLEPVRCYSLEPESSASANSATWATGMNKPGRNLPASLRCAQASSSRFRKGDVLNAHYRGQTRVGLGRCAAMSMACHKIFQPPALEQLTAVSETSPGPQLNCVGRRPN